MRVPDHALVRSLLAEFGAPILSTTLMLPGDERAIGDPADLRGRTAGIDVVIDAGAVAAVPTTVIDLAAPSAQIVRLGGGDPARLGLAPA